MGALKDVAVLLVCEIAIVRIRMMKAQRVKQIIRELGIALESPGTGNSTYKIWPKLMLLSPMLRSIRASS